MAKRTSALAGLRAASCQSQGLLRLPTSLQSAISAFIGEIPTREVKQNVARLTLNMRARKEAAMISMDLHAGEGSEDARAAVDEYLGRTTTTQLRLSKDIFSPAQRPVRYDYDESNTAAYVAARMPAVYGAVYRVLAEVSSRLPEFTPSRVLDYGSGPGTVLWAMREVWPEGVEHVNLVEPSRAMTTACRTLLQDVENLPLIKVHPSLSVVSRSLRKNARHHDLVISSYALGELSTTEERISTVRQLWALTSDILVLIEPGTPQGSSIVREVRAHILQMEKKKLRRSTDSEKGRIFPTGCEGRGAFVVAPCPHDGQCPMDKTNNWCHFIQRLERTPSQRVTKRSNKLSLRAYEDEKFSFVVIRRGIRPSLPYPLEGLQFESTTELSEADDDDYEDLESSTGNQFVVTSNDSHQELAVEEEDELDEYEDEKDDEDVDIGGNVADVGSGWARIVRTPIRRGRRTILDLCVAVEKDGSRGQSPVLSAHEGGMQPLCIHKLESRDGEISGLANMMKETYSLRPELKIKGIAIRMGALYSSLFPCIITV